MELNEFLNKIQHEIGDEVAARSAMPGAGVAFPELVFTGVYTGYMAAAGLTFAPQVCHYDATTDEGRLRLSGYALSADTGQLDLFVSLYQAAPAPAAVDDADLICAAEQCARFLRLCVQGTLSDRVDQSHDAYALVQTLLLAFTSLQRIRIYVLTDGMAAVPVMPSFTVLSVTVESEVIDIAVLSRVMQDEGLQAGFRQLSWFRSELVATVRAGAVIRADSVANVYAEDAGARLADAEEIPDFQRCQFRSADGHGRQLQVDGYAFDEADSSLALIVTDYSDADDLQVIGAQEIAGAFGRLQCFAEDALRGAAMPPGAAAGDAGSGLAADIAGRRAEIARLRLYLASDRLGGECDLPVLPDIGGVPAELHLWDIARFHKAFTSDSGKDHFEVDFRRAGGSGLPALHAGSACGEYEGYLCTVSGDVLAEVYEQYGSRLLEGNVRSFLSVKGKINSGIQGTIQEKPAMFFAYNNGIAATADEVVLDEGGSLRISIARNFQIVNGGQTTASLAAAARAGADLSQVLVQMKLSVLPASRAGELIPLIARFANSQNKVNESDFFANHPYHVRLEQISRRVTMPAAEGSSGGTHWFYERSRGQYLNEQKNLNRQEKAGFLAKYPKAQLLTKLDVAKLENTWNGLPHKVSTGAQKNFLFFAGMLSKAWTKNEAGFDDRYFRKLAAMALMFRDAEVLVAQQDWYQGAYRPNIVTYTLALLQFMVHQQGKGREVNYHRIWVTQQVPEPLRALMARVAHAVFLALTDPGRPKANVTEWAKSDVCWARTRDAAMPLGQSVLDVLEDPATARARDADAAVDDQARYGVFASTAVRGIDASVWAEMLLWGEQRELLNALEVRMLRSATRLPRFAPPVHECEKIWSVRARLIRSGFGAHTAAAR